MDNTRDAGIAGRPFAVRHTALMIGAFAIAMSGPSVAAGGGRPWAQVAASLLIAALSVSYGRAVAHLIELPSRGALTSAFEIVAGFAAVSVIHLLATAALHVSALPALAIDAVGGAALVLASRRTPPLDETTNPDGDSGLFPALVDAATLVAAGLVAALWAREGITALGHAQASGVFRAWTDYFMHASEITYLREYSSYGGESLYLAGTPQPFYHRASYAMPALFSALSGSSSLITATAFWLPLSLTLCALGAYGFGAAIGGRPGGIAAAAVLFLVPDASAYGLRNRFFSFFWLMQTGPGAGYAVAMTLVALGLIVSRPARGRGRWLVVSGLLAAGAALFRVHVAVLGAALVLPLALVAWPGARWKKGVAVAAAAMLAVAAALVFERIDLAPHFFSARADPRAFFEFALAQGPDHGARYARLAAGGSAAWSTTVGFVLTLAEAFGAMLPAALLLAIVRGPGALPRESALIAFLLPVAYLGLVLVMPTPAHGDYTEYAHRAFVLMYAVLAALAGAAVARRLSLRTPQISSRRASMAAAAVVAIALACAVPWKYGRDIQRRWAPQLAVFPLSPSTVEAAAYVRTHATRGERVLVSDGDPRAMFVALSERPAFLSRADLYHRLGGAAGNVAAARIHAQAALPGITRYEDLQDFGRTNGIAWYVLMDADMPAWPDALKARCGYCRPDVRVFDLR